MFNSRCLIIWIKRNKSHRTLQMEVKNVIEEEHSPRGHTTRWLQRWVNMRAVFETTPRFEDYK